MIDSEQPEDSHRKIRNLAVASLCFVFLAFVLVPTAFVLDNMGFIGWAPHDLLMFIALLLVIVGAISGHVALKKIKVNPETPGKYRRLALAGAIIGYGGVALCVVVFAYFWFIVFPNAFSSH